MGGIPGFTLGKELYRSGSTIVSRATRRDDGLPVVLKYCASEYPSPKEAARLRNEFDVLREFNSPHVLKAHGLARVRNTIVLVLEDFNAVDLEAYLSRAGELSMESFLEIAVSVADGLAAIHAAHIIHKDLSPANILIDPVTGTVKLADLGTATRLSRETQQFQSPRTLEGTLAYISPEQTGRMNRCLDYRTDLYSFGATLYHLLAQAPPFAGTDAMELVHCHIAREPRPLSEVSPRIAPPICAIVAKLLAKGTAERYQSAVGVRHDLIQCRRLLREEGVITGLTLALKDVSQRFELPQRIFGRETEIATLMEAFEEVAQGSTELLLVGGYSGIGKSSLVKEVHKPIVRRRGYFISGKYDQFDRGIPYSALAQAFTEMVHTILTEPAGQVAQWKSRIEGVLAPNGRIIVELIPALEQLIGAQPPVPALPPSEAQSRFTLVFQDFVRVFAGSDHPLVLFLDDLQWADNPSLNFLESLLLKARTPHLFIIAAYRDNEVDAAHAFMLAVQAIRKSGTPVRALTLSPLWLDDVAALIAETFRTARREVLPLARLLHEKTGGNPFFLIQLLYSLHDQGMLHLSPVDGRWSFDLEKIRRVGITSNIVDLMTSRIERLPEACKDALKGAACAGNSFDLKMLSTILQNSYHHTARHIWPALREGLIVPVSESYGVVHEHESSHADGVGIRALITEALQGEIESGLFNVRYRFLHDRVQQAAYLLIPEDQKKAEHLKIGRLLLAGTPTPEALDEDIFEIVHHFNMGLDLVEGEEEKALLAGLNLKAGKRAKGAAANKAAVDHFSIAIGLLGEDGWERHYELMLPLYQGEAECRYLIGDFEGSDRCSREAISHGKTKLEKAEGYAARVQLFMTGSEFAKAMQAGIEAVALFGFIVPESEEEKAKACAAVLARIEERLKGVEIATLVDLPATTDPEKKAALELLVHTWCAGYFGQDRSLSALSVYWTVATSLECGNTDASAMGYVLHGMLLGVAGEYRRGYEFGVLGKKLNEDRFPNPLYQPKVNNMFANALNPYFNHLETNLDYYMIGYRTGPQVGDIIYGVWAAHFMILVRTMKGDQLSEVLAESDKYLAFVREIRDANIVTAYELHRQIVMSLQGVTEAPGSLDTEEFHEAKSLEQFDQSDFHVGRLWHGVFKSGLQVHLRQFREALVTAAGTEGALPFDMGQWSATNHFFYQALAIIGAHPELSDAEREEYAPLLQRNLDRFRLWSETGPVNFLHRHQLMLAEKARLEGRDLEAAHYYDLSIEQAASGNFTHDEALALEWAARFYLARGRRRLSQVYLTDAYYAYVRWGAHAKTRLLEQEFPLLPRREGAQEGKGGLLPGGFTVAPWEKDDGKLDFATVIKAIQAISGEIVEEKLLVTVMTILTENAGAQRGILILQREGQLVVEVEAGTGQCTTPKCPLELFPEVIHGMVNLVHRTRQSCVVDDAREDGRFVADPYLMRVQPRSALCTPIVNQGRLFGLAYFENNLSCNVFTRERLTVIELLISQAAIAIENSALYQQLEERVEERTRELAYSLSVLNATLNSTADGILATEFSSGAHCANTQFRTMWNIPPEMLASSDAETLVAFVAPQVKDPERFLARIMETYATPEMEFFDVIELKDGRTFERYSKPQRINGEAVGRVVNFRDITERRRQERALREAQSEVVTASRKAGMAEIASSVLHNVGNVLNSVNVSANLITALVQGSKAGGLAKAVQVIEEHASDLGAFLTEDERGKLIPGYLAKLAGVLAKERQEIGAEVALLVKSVDHIKEIVATQQVFAGAPGIIEPVQVAELIEDALRMYAGSLERDRVTVLREVAEMPEFPLDRTRVLQILVNLISNATQALRDATVSERRIIVHAESPRAGALRISVTDDGEGIPPENLTRIFNHGFTTRKDGHGFGLHSCALAAREMGGTLTVQSDGPGRGAAFTLELPVSCDTRRG